MGAYKTIMLNELTRDWLPKIVAKMAAENAVNVTNSEIERTLGGCVAANRLIPAAKRLRDCDILTLESIKSL